MNKVRVEGVDTVTQILDAAERLVQVRGFNGFSYADVAGQLNLTKAALHYHFAGKAELGEALITRYATRFAEALTTLETRTTEAAARLDAYADLYLDVLRGHRMCLCGMMAAEYETLPLPMQDAVVRFFEDNERWVARVLEQGRREGALAFTGPPQEMARMIVSGAGGGDARGPALRRHCAVSTNRRSPALRSEVGTTESRRIPEWVEEVAIAVRGASDLLQESGGTASSHRRDGSHPLRGYDRTVVAQGVESCRPGLELFSTSATKGNVVESDSTFIEYIVLELLAVCVDCKHRLKPNRRSKGVLVDYRNRRRVEQALVPLDASLEIGSCQGVMVESWK